MRKLEQKSPVAIPHSLVTEEENVCLLHKFPVVFVMDIRQYMHIGSDDLAGLPGKRKQRTVEVDIAGHYQIDPLQHGPIKIIGRFLNVLQVAVDLPLALRVV